MSVPSRTHTTLWRIPTTFPFPRPPSQGALSPYSSTIKILNVTAVASSLGLAILSPLSSHNDFAAVQFMGESGKYLKHCPPDSGTVKKPLGHTAGVVVTGVVVANVDSYSHNG